MQGKLIAWAVWFFIIVMSAFIVPFYFLSEVTRIYGAFLYWGIFAVAAIISVGMITSKWRD